MLNIKNILSCTILKKDHYLQYLKYIIMYNPSTINIENCNFIYKRNTLDCYEHI